jgi:hypothetical protein
VEKMHNDIVFILAEPALKIEVRAVAGSPELAAKAQADTDLWGPIIKAANVTPE